MKTKILFVAFILLTSCSLFKSKETLLTQDQWILTVEVISNISPDKFGTFSKSYALSDSVMVLDFMMEGIVHIKEDHEWSTGTWEFREKDVIEVLSHGDYKDYSIAELNNDKLMIHFNESAFLNKTLLFRHPD